MTTLNLLDGSLKLSVYVDEADRGFEDDICLQFVEDCAEDEKVFRADDTRIYLTPEEAGLLILELTRVLESHRKMPGPDR
jgi:hypothetical protein